MIIYALLKLMYVELKEEFLCVFVQDVLYTVCNPIGSVLRIVIFKRNGIQAMVEYPFRQGSLRLHALVI